jgi:hypothetical protein
MAEEIRGDNRSLMILVAGPYRSGTDDDPVRIEENMYAMNEAALRLFRAGHLAITGEAIGLPLAELAGSLRVGDAAFDEIMHPIGRMLAQQCDAVLRIGGKSAGADEMVEITRTHGGEVYMRIEDVPGIE